MAVQEAFSTSLPLEEIASHAAAVDREARFPRESVDALARAGALGLAVPERFGGAGAGPVEVVEAVEQVAGACASTGMVFVMHVVAMQTLARGHRRTTNPRARSTRRWRRPRAASTCRRSRTPSAGRAGTSGRRSRARAPTAAACVDRRRQELRDVGRRGRLLRAGVRRARVGRPAGTELYLVPGDAPGHRGRRAVRRARACAATRPRRCASAGCASPPTGGSGEPRLAASADDAGDAAVVRARLGGVLRRHRRAPRSRPRSSTRRARGFEHLGSTLADVPGVRARLARGAGSATRRRARTSTRRARQSPHGAPDAQLGVLALKAAAAEMAVDVTRSLPARRRRRGVRQARPARAPLPRRARRVGDGAHDRPAARLPRQGPLRPGAVLMPRRLPARRRRLPPEGRADLARVRRLVRTSRASRSTPRYYDRYEDQVDDLARRRSSTRRGTRTSPTCSALRARRRHARALAMRDTDRGWRSLIVARADSGLRVARGSARPARRLRRRRLAAGADPARARAARRRASTPLRDCAATPAGPRRRQARRHRRRGAGPARARARRRARRVRGLERHVRRDRAHRRRRRPRDGLALAAVPPLLLHASCATTTRHERFAELLFCDGRRPTPSCASRWSSSTSTAGCRSTPSGYRDLIDAVRAGPVVVGEVELAA